MEEVRRSWKHLPQWVVTTCKHHLISLPSFSLLLYVVLCVLLKVGWWSQLITIPPEEALSLWWYLWPFRDKQRWGKENKNKTVPFRQWWWMMFWGQCENGRVFRWNSFISLCGYSCAWTSRMWFYQSNLICGDVWSGPAVEVIKTASCCFLARNPLHVTYFL